MEGWFPDLSSLGPPSRENDDALHRNVRQRPNPPVDMPNNEPVPVFASVDDLEPSDRAKREARDHHALGRWHLLLGHGQFSSDFGAFGRLFGL